MAQITSDIQATPAGLFTSTADQQAILGSRAVASDGREFRYAKAGAVALVPGTLVQAAAEITNHQNIAPADAVAGATSITVTLGATAVTANQYAGGWAVVTTSTGAGYQYQISGHPAAALSTAVVLTLVEPLQTALAASTSKIDLVANTYNGVVINPATATSNPVGAAVYPIAIGQFGWIQVKGPANLLADGTVVVGTGLVASNATAGAVEALTGVQAPIGTAITGIATTQYGAVNLDL